jgi:sugar/nucleoside kinase (ribokinase family)
MVLIEATPNGLSAAAIVCGVDNQAIRPTVVVVGCLTIDSVVEASGALIRNACGGNALYAAAGAHVWERRVGIVARAGRGYPAACLDSIGASVDIAGVRRLVGDHPIRVAFAYRSDGSRSRTVPPGALATIPAAIRGDFVDTTRDDARYLAATPTPGDVPPDWLEGAVGFHLPALLESSLRQLVAAIRVARPKALITVDAPWFTRRDGTLSADLGWLADVDAVLPSEEDLLAYRPGVPIVEAARDLVRSGARAVAVKVGARGSIVVDADGGVSHVPAYPADAVDPTGAGDSYCGGFLAGLNETGDLVRAAAYGTVAASFVVEQPAAIPVLSITRAEALPRLPMVEGGVRSGITGDAEWRDP